MIVSMDTNDSTQPQKFGPGADLKRAVTIAHKLLDDLLSSHMAGLGLSLGEADVLTVVLLAEQAPAPTAIADWLSLTTAGTTGRLNTLERKRLIERRPHPSDGRRITVHLTARGESLAQAVLEAKDEALLSPVVGGLGKARVEGLTHELDALIAAASEALEGG